MRILQASSEVFPYSKSGGLADVVGALSCALADTGHRVGVVTPLYKWIFEKHPDLYRFDYSLEISLAGRFVQAEVWVLEPQENLTLYFIHCPHLYFRNSYYQENGQDYSDNAERFVFFSKCIEHLARYLTWKPEVVHCHDWQTALVPLLFREAVIHRDWQDVPVCCYTIHNLAYQGIFPADVMDIIEIGPEYWSVEGLEFYGKCNLMKAGLLYADLITTVSPRYALEILTEEYGCGLEGVIQDRSDRLVGILNGVDYREWKTKKNPFLDVSYHLKSMKGKGVLKLKLQATYGLPQDKGIPLFAVVSRLVLQKGVDILLESLEILLAVHRFQFVLLGTGMPEFEQRFRLLQEKYPDQVSINIGFENALSHQIEAGSDFFLMPSRFEPCGLNQIYSQRYGSIPVVRRTGGLDDSVIDISDEPDLATGLKFKQYDTEALSAVIVKALDLYRTPVAFRKIRANGMRADFSWEKTCQLYVNQYEKMNPTRALPISEESDVR